MMKSREVDERGERQERQEIAARQHAVQELLIVGRAELRVMHHVARRVVFRLRGRDAAQLRGERLRALHEPALADEEDAMRGPFVQREHAERVQQVAVQAARNRGGGERRRDRGGLAWRDWPGVMNHAGSFISTR